MRYIILITMLMTIAMQSSAGDFHVVLNGKAIHLDEGEYNEENWGLGLQYDFNPQDDWTKFVNASWFKDSNYNTSKYVGGGIRRRYHLDSHADGWFFDYGAIAFLMTRKDFKNNNPFFGVLPFLSVGNGPVTLNMTYIPSVSPKHKEILYFQFMVRLPSFN